MQQHDMPPERAARAAGLRYSLDAQAGISRRPSGKGFQYLGPEGKVIRDPEVLRRIRALAIPPAWTGVWICPREDGHLQATGRDARGRKQYRYHARWREIRDETKFHRMAAFTRALPRIRRRVRRDLGAQGLPREKALATVVRLLETTFMRVGNEAYARENDSYGLTTLRGRQVRVHGHRLRFRFRGKSGIEHRIELREPRLAAIVRRMQDLPGQELFQYVNEAGTVRGIESADVNAYLREIAGEAFTTKDFRTWAGTMLAMKALQEAPSCSSLQAARRNVVQAVDVVARQLGNTRAVCRKCYIHPEVIESYLREAAGTATRRARRRSASSKSHSRGTAIAGLRDAVSLFNLS